MARPLIFLLILAMASAQRSPRENIEEDKPGGGANMKRSQVEAILKADREKSLEDAGEIVKLGQELRDEIEKNDKSVLSILAMKKAEEIEKLAKRIRGRMRRY